MNKYECGGCGEKHSDEDHVCKRTSPASDCYDTKKCPDCGEVVTFESSPDFNRIKPWEVYCGACGWFHRDRFVSIGDAANAVS